MESLLLLLANILLLHINHCQYIGRCGAGASKLFECRGWNV